MGKKILLTTNLPRETGYLYYLSGDPLKICRVEMNRGGSKKRSKKKKK